PDNEDEESFFRANIASWREKVFRDNWTVETTKPGDGEISNGIASISALSQVAAIPDRRQEELQVEIVDIQPIASQETTAAGTEPENGFPLDPEAMLNTMARLCAAEGKAREVAIMANSTPKIVETEYDNWNGGVFGYRLYLQVPARIYAEIASARDEAER